MRFLQTSFLVTSTLLATVLSAQSPLAIVNNSFPTGAVGQVYAQALGATGGIQPYVWSYTGQIPPGLQVNSVGTISGTPTVGGTYAFTLTVADAHQTSVSKTLSIIITGPGGTRLTVTTTTLPPGNLGQSYSQTLTATGGAPPYQWAAGTGFPSFLTLDTNLGTVSGTPTAAGTFTFPVQVTDSVKTTATSTVSLTIVSPPPSITTLAPIFSGTVGVLYDQTFRATGGNPPYTWAILTGSTGGLTLDPNTGDLQGTPQTAGTFTFTVQARDQSGATATQSFSLVINAPTLSITVGSPLPAATVAVAYTQKLPVVANGGTPPYTWSLIAGSVPGLTFDPAGLTLSGTPSTAGTFNLTIQAADSANLTTTRSLSLTVNPVSLSITTARQLPDARLNQPYTLSIAASGGQPPYQWSMNGQPTGLSINSTTGQITGTPTAAGNFGIAITVRDSALANFSDRFTLAVDLPSGPGATISGLPATAAPAQQYTLQVQTDSTYPAPISGQAILSFSPDTGPADRTIQFSTGGTTATFDIPVGSTSASAPIAIQTGTVSGTINITLRLQAGGIDITPSPAPTITSQVVRAAPVVKSVQVNRSGSTINIVVTGYSTAREVTQAVFAFNAASGQTLAPSASSITVDTNSLFGNWFVDPANSQFGSVFIFTQPFTVQGDATAVIPASVTLTNRTGSATSNISQ
jgi:Putative Ig domain